MPVILHHIFRMCSKQTNKNCSWKKKCKTHPVFSDIKGYFLCVWRLWTLWWFSWRSAPCCWWYLARWGHSVYVLSTLPCPVNINQTRGLYFYILNTNYNGSCMTCEIYKNIPQVLVTACVSWLNNSLIISLGLTLDLLLHSRHSQLK